MAGQHEQLTQLLAVPTLKDDIYHQYLVMVLLKEMWPALPPAQQQLYTRQMCEAIRRCRDATKPEVVFQQLLRLEEDELYDALRFDWTQANKYQLDPGEEIYPEASISSRSWLSRYLWWARIGNAPLAFHVWSGLAVLGTVAQRRIFFPGGRRIWMNSYIMLGGDRSSGKGQAFEAAMLIMNKVNQLIASESWDEATKRQRRLNLMPSDVTSESLVTEMRNRITGVGDAVTEEDEETGVTRVRFENLDEQVADATGLIPLDEAATFFGKDAWGAARKGVFLTTLKESERYTKSTKRSGYEELDKLAIGMLACCAPTWMHSVIDRDYLGGGLMDRVVWVFRPPSWRRRRETNIRSSPPKDPLIAMGLARWLVDKVLCHPVKIPAQMTPEAEARIDQFYLDLLDREEEAHRKFGTDADVTTANRAIWATIQVATLLAMAEGEFPPLIVNEGHAGTAILWIRAEEHSMRDFMKETAKSASQLLEQKMLDYLGRCGGCSMKSTFNQEFRQHGMSHELAKAVRSLEDQGRVETRKRVENRKITYYRLVGHECEECQ